MSDAIRAATPQDAAELAELIRLLAAENSDPTGLTAEYARHYLETRDCGAFLAEAAGGPVGVLTYSLRPGLYHAAPSLVIEELFVLPAYRGRRIGRRLVEQAVRLARERGCAEISVSTGLDNLRAQGLYRSAGLVDESLLLEMHF